MDAKSVSNSRKVEGAFGIGQTNQFEVLLRYALGTKSYQVLNKFTITQQFGLIDFYRVNARKKFLWFFKKSVCFELLIV